MPRRTSLRVLSFNAHVGIGLRNGGLRWALRKRQADLVAIQEGRGVTALRNALGALFRRFPLRQPGKTNRDQAMTYVAWRKRRFVFIEGINKNTRHGSHYPRRMPGVVLGDKATGRTVVFSSLHPDPLGLGFAKASPRARAKHILQVKAHRAWHLEMAAKYPNAVHICAGDANEVLTASAHRRLPAKLKAVSARGLLGDAGMKPLHDAVPDGGGVHLDDVFYGGRGLEPVERDAFRVPRRGIDHDTVWGAFTLAA